MPVVKFKNIPGQRVIPFKTWDASPPSEMLKKYGIKGRHSMKHPKCAYAKQIPLKVAFALTIDRAQGLTLDKVGANLQDGIFRAGKAYVALSRCRTLQGLWLIAFDRSSIQVHPKAVAFYRKYEKKDEPIVVVSDDEG
jgi:hypothetical protein